MDEVVVVSGLPRSGTSLMMQMLEAGGVGAWTDAQRAADADNPAGYFELEAVKGLARGEDAFLDAAPGRAVKVIHALVKYLPPRHRYAVVFMVRDLAEVVASQRVMLERRGGPGPRLDDGRLSAALARQRDEALAWLEGREGVRVLRVEHREAVTLPADVAERVAAFLGGGLDASAMAGVVRPALHRHRGEG